MSTGGDRGFARVQLLEFEVGISESASELELLLIFDGDLWLLPVNECFDLRERVFFVKLNNVLQLVFGHQIVTIQSNFQHIRQSNLPHIFINITYFLDPEVFSGHIN